MEALMDKHETKPPRHASLILRWKLNDRFGGPECGLDGTRAQAPNTLRWKRFSAEAA
jgi:hypothetical protein